MPDAIDDLLDSIERMIDAKDDIHEEDKYSNYRQVMSIKTDRYIPAREQARERLRAVIVDIVRQEMSKQPEHKNLGIL